MPPPRRQWTADGKESAREWVWMKFGPVIVAVVVGDDFADIDRVIAELERVRYAVPANDEQLRLCRVSRRDVIEVWWTGRVAWLADRIRAKRDAIGEQVIALRRIINLFEIGLVIRGC